MLVSRNVGAAVAFVAVLGAGCSGAGDPSAPATTEQPTPGVSATTEPTTGTPTTPSADESDTPSSPTSADVSAAPLSEASATWATVGEGFEGPVQVLDGPAGAVLVVEQTGRVRTLSGDPWLDLRDRVTAGGERGLLGVAVAPDGGTAFVHYSGADGRTVLSRFPVADGAVDASDEEVLLEVAQPAANHNGGSLLFDPEGFLVLALGDGGAAGDRFDNGQDTSTLLGALLRFDVSDGGFAPAPDNPFVDGGGAEALWAYGLRNPWRVAFDDVGRLYVADVGQDAIEEVSVVPYAEVAGANYGWPILEGSACYRSEGCDASGTVPPVAELRHADGACSIIGGVVVPDGHPTGLGGAYLYSDLCDTRLRALRVTGDGVEQAVVAGAELPASPLGFGTGEDGEVWVGTTDGQVRELRGG